MDPVKAFAAVLRMKRTRHKLSQEKLALEAGLDRTFVSLLERGKRNPSLRSIFALARVLKTRPSKLIEAAEEVAEMGSEPRAKA